MGIGIAIDILVLLVILSMLLRGKRQGFVYQLAALAFYVPAYFIARAVTDSWDMKLAESIGLNPIFSSTLVFIAIFSALTVVGGWFTRRLSSGIIPAKGSLNGTNALFGMLLGGAKGLLFAYVGVVLLLQVQRLATSTPFPWQSSAAASWVSENNALDRGETGALLKLVWLVSTHDIAQLATDPRGKRLINHPKASPLKSPELVEAMAQQNYAKLLANEDLWTFLKDAEVQAILDSFPWVKSDPPAGSQPG